MVKTFNDDQTKGTYHTGSCCYGAHEERGPYTSFCKLRTCSLFAIGPKVNSLGPPIYMERRGVYCPGDQALSLLSNDHKIQWV